MIMQITVDNKSTNSTMVIYPACTTSRLFAEIADSKTLSPLALNAIKALGYTVNVKNDKLMTQSMCLHEYVNRMRSVRQGQFSYNALVALFAHLQSQDAEFDAIGICCDYAEYASATEAGIAQGFTVDTALTAAELEQVFMQKLRQGTVVIPCSLSIVIQNY